MAVRGRWLRLAVGLIIYGAAVVVVTRKLLACNCTQEPLATDGFARHQALPWSDGIRVDKSAVQGLFHMGGNNPSAPKSSSPPLQSQLDQLLGQFHLWLLSDKCITHSDRNGGLLMAAQCQPDSPQQRFIVSAGGHLFLDLPARGRLCLHLDRRHPRPGSTPPAKVVGSMCTALPNVGVVYKESGERFADTWQFKPGIGIVHQPSGLCATLDYAYGLVVQTCGQYPGEQAVLRVSFNHTRLQPMDFDKWAHFWALQRQEALEHLIQDLQDTAAAVTTDILPRNVLQPADGSGGVKGIKPRGRRVVVFFLDAKGRQLVQQVKWWLYAWRSLRLDAPDQKFDVFIMGNGKPFDYIASQGCEVKTLAPPPAIPGKDDPGVCWLFPFTGIHERDPATFDGWLNSIEVLVNPQVKPLLLQYDQLLRADADTLPTPMMRGYWRDTLYMGDNAAYATDFADSKLALAAKEAGLGTAGQHNIASTYYGPVREVLRVAQLTIPAAAYLRTFLFARGTGCRLPPVLRPPSVDCNWGSGLWEGVALLYSQQLAVNHLLSQGMAVTFGQIMDQTTTEQADICGIHMLHVLHNADRFSKFALQRGHYKGFDMAQLDIRYARDYMTFCALVANGQGVNGDDALALAGGDLAAICG